MNMNNILKDCHTEKDAKALTEIMGYTSTIYEMINKCCDALDEFTFQSKELIMLNRLIYEAKGMFSDFDYETREIKENDRITL